MFGGSLLNFEDGYDRPAPFDIRPTDLFRGVHNFPNYGWDAANPLHMEYLLAALESVPDTGNQYRFKYVDRTIGYPGGSIIPAPFYEDGEVDVQRYFEWAQGEAPLLPTLFFTSNPHNTVHIGQWTATSTTPLIKLHTRYFTDEEIQWMIDTGLIDSKDDLFLTVGYSDSDPNKREWDKYPYYLGPMPNPPLHAFGNLFSAGAGRVTEPYVSQKAAFNSASGDYYYGGPVVFTLVGNVSFGDAQTPFPFKKYTFDGGLATFSNPETGKYTLDEAFTQHLQDRNVSRLYTGFNACYPLSRGMDSLYLFSESLKFKKEVVATCMPLVNEEYPGESRRDAGYWGTIVRFGMSHVLQYMPESGWFIFLKGDEVNAFGGFGLMMTHDMVSLATQNGKLLDNPEVLAAWEKPEWLQKAVDDVKARVAGYSEYGPYFGAYVMPNYTYPIWPVPVNPVCQFDTNCQIMSNIYGIGDEQEQVEHGLAQEKGFVPGANSLNFAYYESSIVFFDDGNYQFTSKAYSGIGISLGIRILCRFLPGPAFDFVDGMEFNQ